MVDAALEAGGPRNAVLLEDRRAGEASDAVVAVDDDEHPFGYVEFCGAVVQFAERNMRAVADAAVGALGILADVDE